MIIETNKRIDAFDLLKTLSIFIVIFYHSFTADIDINRHITLTSGFNYIFKSVVGISVPIFFLVNGSILFRKPLFLKRHIHKMVYMIMLVAVWDILDVFVKMFLRGEMLSAKEFLKKCWLFEAGWSNQLWFLMALCVIYMFFPMMKESFDHGKQGLKVITVIAFIAVIGNSAVLIVINIGCYILGIRINGIETDFLNQLNPFRGLYGFSFFYFLLGAFLPDYVEKMKKWVPKEIWILLAILGIVLSGVYGMIRVAMNPSVLFDTGWEGMGSAWIFFSIVSIFCLCMGYKKRENNKLCVMIESISRNSLGIYLLQTILADVGKKYFQMLSISGNLAVNLLFSFFLLILCWGITLIIKNIPILKKLVVSG